MNLLANKISPTNILYYPYLSGSGAPLPDPTVRGAFIGLSSEHDKADLIKAILEGVSMEMESIRRTAENIINKKISSITAVGGGTANKYWMKLKADISGCSLNIPSLTEATLLGAALVGAVGNGFYRNFQEAVNTLRFKPASKYQVDWEQHQLYKDLYENKYMVFQDSLRKSYK